MMIFCDMDGVLSDFCGGCAKLSGVTAPPRDGTYDACEMTEKFGKGIWDEINDAGSKFWAGLAEYTWTRPLWDYLTSTAPEAAFICSSPGSMITAMTSAPGKYNWCRTKLRLTPPQIVLTRSKHLLAAPGRILIDDTDEMIERWEAAGGEGILFPQPWNKNYALARPGVDPVEYIVDRIGAIRFG